jgi:hypothetical protein
MIGDTPEVYVGCQHRKIVADAQMRQQRIDRSHLYAVSSTVILQLSRANMVVAIRHQ